MTAIVGVDPGASKLALAAWEHTWQVDVFHCSVDAPRADQLAELSAHTIEMIAAYPGCLVWVEDPVMVRNAKTVTRQAQAQGVILSSCVQAGASGVYTVGNTAWKREVCGDGRAGKPAIKSWLEHSFDDFPAGVTDADLVDAIAITCYGHRIHQRAGRFVGPASGSARSP